MALGGSTGLCSGCLCNSLAVGLSRKLKTEYLSLRTFGTPTRVELQCKITRHRNNTIAFNIIYGCRTEWPGFKI